MYHLHTILNTKIKSKPKKLEFKQTVSINRAGDERLGVFASNLKKMANKTDYKLRCDICKLPNSSYYPFHLK